jgi:hypothetical protein
MSSRFIQIFIVGQLLIDLAIAAYALSGWLWSNKVTEILLSGL